jgi:hypothetical protein
MKNCLNCNQKGTRKVILSAGGFKPKKINVCVICGFPIGKMSIFWFNFYKELNNFEVN